MDYLLVRTCFCTCGLDGFGGKVTRFSLDRFRPFCAVFSAFISPDFTPFFFSRFLYRLDTAFDGFFWGGSRFLPPWQLNYNKIPYLKIKSFGKLADSSKINKFTN